MEHGLPYLVNCSILFTETPLLERPAAAKAAGFDAVEFWWPFDDAGPSDPDVDRFVSAVQDAGVQLVGLNFAAGDMPGRDRGLVSWPGRSAEFRDSVATAVGIGDRLGTRAFNALYGNRIDGSTPEEQDELAATNLARAAEAAARIGAVVLLEPVSGAARYPLLVADDVTAVLDRVERQSGADNFRLLADLYHLSVNGDDLDSVVGRHACPDRSRADRGRAGTPRARHRRARPRPPPAGAAGRRVRRLGRAGVRALHDHRGRPRLAPARPSGRHRPRDLTRTSIHISGGRGT